MRRSFLHKSSSFRRTFVQRIACLSLLLGGLIVPVRAADSQPRVDAAVDHPILVVAAASIDRLHERTTTLLEAAGRDASSDAIRKLLSTIDGKFLTDIKGADTTKPIGAFIFFGSGVAQPKQEQQPDQSPKEPTSDDTATSDEESSD